jgi:hypothetical protein
LITAFAAIAKFPEAAFIIQLRVEDQVNLVVCRWAGQTLHLVHTITMPRNGRHVHLFLHTRAIQHRPRRHRTARGRATGLSISREQQPAVRAGVASFLADHDIRPKMQHIYRGARGGILFNTDRALRRTDEKRGSVPSRPPSTQTHSPRDTCVRLCHSFLHFGLVSSPISPNLALGLEPNLAKISAHPATEDRRYKLHSKCPSAPVR